MAIRKTNQPPREPVYVPPLDDPSFVWTSYDLHCCAALLCKGFELLTMDKGADGRKSLFVFKREADIDAVVDDYWSDRLEVKARTFADTIKALKNRLYSN